MKKDPSTYAVLGAASSLAYKRLVFSQEKICANPVNLRCSNPSPEPHVPHS